MTAGLLSFDCLCTTRKATHLIGSRPHPAFRRIVRGGLSRYKTGGWTISFPVAGTLHAIPD
ncbi:MAG TPA: hypothetical protein PKH71_06925, partial [Methanoregulaceae archaeon]|nr:hypothetical protein [Methanoregulaceae archaeon]